MVAKVTEFKGHKVLTLANSKDDKYTFKFGIAKEKLIMDNMDNVDGIKKFI